MGYQIVQSRLIKFSILVFIWKKINKNLDTTFIAYKLNEKDTCSNVFSSKKKVVAM